MDSLIFVDTNIFLDFYRVRGSGAGLELLKLIEKHKDILITGSQVEMEYKKNRQRVILDAHNAIKTPDWSGLTPPAFLADATPSNIIARSKKTIAEQQVNLKKRISTLLASPSSRDPVFATLQRVFGNPSPYNLTRDKKIRFSVRHMARKRFVLGYPPRKTNDTSIGDAINWEWIIHCASISGKGIIVVTRDSDYGIHHGGEFFLNDWLRLEFRERVGARREIILTDRLADAFKRVSIAVSAAAEQEEREFIKGTIGDFAHELRVSPGVLIEQLRAAGMEKSTVDDHVSETDKTRLLDYLRRIHPDVLR